MRFQLVLLSAFALISALWLAVVPATAVKLAPATAVKLALAGQPIARSVVRLAASAPIMASSTFTQITAGGAHTCAVIGSGGVQCWGLNTSGQLGNGNTDNRTKPTAVVSLNSGVSLVTAGDTHTCALTTTGGVYCWGNNVKGQLGVSTADFIQSTPLAVTGLTSGVRTVAAGTHHTCALTVNGGVQCWGFNGDGQLGDGSHSPSTTPVSVVGLSSGVSAIAVGGLQTCALTTSGGVKCWGDMAGARSTTPVDMAGLTSGVSALAAGGAHTCALLTGGVKCWGSNNAGQLGDNSTTERPTPVDVAGLSSGVAALAAGESHTCALLSGGGVKCWGDNFAGQLGDDTASFHTTPVDVVGLSSGVRAITAGAGHTCALLESNAAKCWGDDFAGQLGDGASLLRSTPLGLPELNDGATRVATGFLHSCLLTLGNGIECWGDNNQSQRGGNPHSGGTAHTPVFSLRSGVTALALGFYHTCALTSIGAVQCWGNNPAGQLGDGTNINQGQPITVTGLSSGVSAIVTGGDHTCALTSGGGVKCWGRNGFRQLGDNTTTHRPTAVDVVGLNSGIDALAAGTFHTCALTNGGGVKCWGRNRYGQLGDGTTTEQPTPVDVPGLSSGVSAIAAAGEHTCALTSSGVQCWGLNSSGQLGDGSLTQRPAPVNVIGLDSGVAAISVGDAHSCALTNAGALNCWGANAAGQLGDGTTLNRTAPVSVSALGTNVSAVSAGNRHTCVLTINNQIFCWGSNHAGQVGDITARQLTPVDVLDSPLPSFDCGAVSQIPRTECDALVTFFNATDGSNWITKTNWLVTNTPCDWVAVGCNQGHVISLSLTSVNLTGVIPPALKDLTFLTQLYLQDNPLTGPIPLELTTITTLITLSLSSNQLSGPIPPEIRNLTNLEHLYLGPNQLTGAIPPELGMLVRLKSLYLHENRLSGVIPPELGNLTSLEILGLGGNELTGALPDALCNLVKLYKLGLNNNQLRQAVPACFVNLTALTELDLGYNALTATEPVRSFLDQKDPDWAQTQTVPPTNLQVTVQSQTAITLIWQPIAYTANNGYYEISYATDQALLYQTTTKAQVDKSIDRHQLTGLTPNMTYHVVLRTFTPAHERQRNDVWSDYSTVVTATTLANDAASDGYEIDNTCTQASTIANDGAVQQHNFYSPDDADWVQFATTQNTRYLVEAITPPDSTADVNIGVYATCDSLSESQAYTYTPDVRLTFTAPATGPLFLKLTNYDPNRAGAAVKYTLAVRALNTTPLPTASAAIIVAGSLGPIDGVINNIYHASDAMYKLFHDQDYTDERIYYLAPNPNRAHVDKAATNANLQAAIERWAVNLVGETGALTLYIIDHGTPAQLIYLDKPNEQSVTPELLDTWLTTFETAHPNAKVNVIIEACYGGTFISQPLTLSKNGRVVITSTSDQELAWAMPAGGARFSDHLIEVLARKSSLLTAFQAGQQAARTFQPSQLAWLDANGNGIENEPADELIAAQRGFDIPGSLGEEWPPYITDAAGPMIIANGEGILRAEVLDDKAVKHVWAMIYPPSYAAPTTGEALVNDEMDERITKLGLTPRGANVYSANFAGFKQMGAYRIVIYAEDEQGLNAQPQMIMVNIRQVFLPLIAR